MDGIVGTVEFQMSLPLFVALAGYLLASRINHSAVVGEILVGLVVGPSVLGLITYTDFVASIAHLGTVILLFVIGLEFEIREIFQGYWVSLLFGFDSASAIFIGTALTATSIAITANILKELGKLDTEVANAIIGAAIIDDILSLIGLSATSECRFRHYQRLIHRSTCGYRGHFCRRRGIYRETLREPANRKNG